LLSGRARRAPRLVAQRVQGRQVAIGVDTAYASHVLLGILVIGAGMGLVFSPPRRPPRSACTPAGEAAFAHG